MPAATATAVQQSVRDYAPGDVLRTPVFWVMYLMFVMVGAGGLMATAQLAPIANDFKIAGTPVSILGLTLPALTFALSIDRVLNGVCRPFFGWVSDNIGRENTMFFAFLAEGIGIYALLQFATDPLMFVILSGVVFFAWGEIYRLFPATCTDTYGKKFATTNYGMLYTAKGTAALLVPLGKILYVLDRQELDRCVHCGGHPQLHRGLHVDRGVAAAAAAGNGEEIGGSDVLLDRNGPPPRRPIALSGRLEYCMPMSTGVRSSSKRRPTDAIPPREFFAPRVAVEPLASESFKRKAYTALRDVIVSLDVYRSRTDIRLDERRLALDFGVSRTPVREAMAQLEREGFVRSVPRRGVYVVRKTKREVIEMITAWAALESMAARLITERASDEEIATLRGMFATFENGKLRAHLDEYSEVNIEFHQTIIRMSRNQVLIDLAENLFTHMRMIRRTTIGEQDRADRSIRDHMNIIEALEARDTARAEDLVRSHALGLAEHVAKHADYLDLTLAAVFVDHAPRCSCRTSSAS